MKRALIIVDVQIDFCKGGSLAVPNGDEVIPVINRLQKKSFDLVVATQDFHPQDHKSFASNNPGKKIGELWKLNGLPQVMWPDHCVQGCRGSEIHPKLDMKKIKKIFQKGTNPEIDSYSGFFDNDKKTSTGLSDYLKANKITDVFVVGLALDYCVKATAIDAVKEGFNTTVFVEATRAVNLCPEDGQKAVEELKLNGVIVI